jgi:hypothetical protein
MVRFEPAKTAAVATLLVVILVALIAPATAVTTSKSASAVNKFNLAADDNAGDNEETPLPVATALTDAAETDSDDSLIELSAVTKNAVAAGMADVPQQWSLVSKFNSDTGSFVAFTTLSVVSDLFDSD